MDKMHKYERRQRRREKEALQGLAMESDRFDVPRDYREMTRSESRSARFVYQASAPRRREFV